MNHPPSATPAPWPRTAALVALTAVAVYCCYLITVPFLPGLTWAVALAVVGLPLHRRVLRAVPAPNWAAGLTTLLVVAAILVPVVLVGVQLANQTAQAVEKVQAEKDQGAWEEYASKVPYVGGRLAQVRVEDVENQLREGVRQFAGHTVGAIGSIGGAALQALVAVFVLFFCFRDRHHLLAEARKFLPFNDGAADKVIARAADAVHATVYGTVLTAFIQGVTGGLLFWALGLPGAVLWGVVMFVLGVLPFLGAFLVWVPAAVFLGMHDRWGAAAALVAWGVTMAGPMSNYVYAYVVGDRMKVHAVPTLIAFIGGLAVFGISGLVLGPCVLAVTLALLDVWRQRTVGGTSVAVFTGSLPLPEDHHDDPRSYRTPAAAAERAE